MRRFVQAFADPGAWPEAWLQKTAKLLGEADDRYNIGPGDDAWIMLSSEGVRAARFRWGLVPPWSREPTTTYTTITARLERASRSRIFGKPWKTQHCIVPMTGYYKLDRTIKPPVPHFIQAREGDPLLAAGLWERWEKDGVVCSFAILTHPNPAIPAPLTPDGPVFLGHAAARAWLQGPQFVAGALLRMANAPELTSYPVSMRYRDRKRDDYTLLEPASASDYLEPVHAAEDDEDE